MKKTIQIEGIGVVTITKKRSARKMTLSITSRGVPNVTIPSYVPYHTGEQFALSKHSWILDHIPRTPELRIGATYELYDGTQVEIHANHGRNSTRRSAGKIEIYTKSKSYAQKQIVKTLLIDSENVISGRITYYQDKIAQPESIRFRATTSRWGSCNSKRVLTFSAYIAQLPNELIDYVVIHELSHLIHMNHGADFWALVETFDPKAKQHRKELKDYPLAPIIKRVVPKAQTQA